MTGEPTTAAERALDRPDQGDGPPPPPRRALSPAGSLSLVAALLLGPATGSACLETEPHRVSADLERTQDVRLTDDTVSRPDAELTDGLDPFDAEDPSPPDIAEVLQPDAAPQDGEPGPEPFVCPLVPFADGLVGGRVNRIDFDPRVPGLAWLTSAQGLMRSLDGGLSWEEAASGRASSRVAFPADDAKRLLSISPAGLAESLDGGLSLTALSLSGLRLTAIATSWPQPSRLFVGTDGGGILRSDNGGGTFITVNVGVPYGQVYSLATSPADADVALAGFAYRNENNAIQSRGGILRTSNAGRTWQLVSDDVVWGHDIIFCPSDPSRAYAAVRRGVLETLDGGQTWSRLPFLAGADVLEVAFGAGGCDNLWISVYQDAIYRLDLSLRSLTGPIRQGIAVERSRFNVSLAPHPRDPLVILLATTAGVFRSGDGGFSFSPVAGPPTLAIGNLAGSLDGGGRLLLSTSGSGLWERVGDAPWRRVTSLERDFIGSVHVDPSRSDRVGVMTTNLSFVSEEGPDALSPVPAPFNNLTHIVWREAAGDILAATQTRGLHRSVDGGRTFTQFNPGLSAWPTPNGTFIDVRWIHVFPDDPERVLLGLRGRGVAAWDPEAEAWSILDGPLAEDEVFQILQAGPYLYARVTGKGLYLSPDEGLSWQPFNDGLGGGDIASVAYDAATDTLFATGASARLHRFDEASRSLESRGRWQLVARGCFDEGTSLGALTIHSRAPGQRDLIVAGNFNRLWRLPLPPP